ncbi:thioredoxin family protein [Lederbergia sp. NSJ-179]|uniref:thioredoxin family protein n=1 Tax=Lederbergia sp. NSJ-179 TaxID=2931402 RepID=UPI001FD60518|nr:thioredoxin family protein [Lederbergia sp. NSJ-179]MCJ7840304.1 thioredoxin family protein [Lederbergia sp. NSJ-179]
MKESTKDEMLKALERKDSVVFYFYTPLCGTCQIAGKMLEIVEKMLPDLPFKKADLNYLPEMAETFSIESVPCLIHLHDGKIQNKIYAFHSVPYLYETLKEPGTARNLSKD